MHIKIEPKLKNIKWLKLWDVLVIFFFVVYRLFLKPMTNFVLYKNIG